MCKTFKKMVVLCIVLVYLLSNVAKGRQAEGDHRVTIDLSALRPSLPGLVLYKYGDMSPKLVQIDLRALNPQLQPHIVWPEFNELELERPFEMDNGDAIPYVTDEDTLMTPKRLARIKDNSRWLESGDVYDFVPDGPLKSLQGSLPVADEVIVPLDWEDKSSTLKDYAKRNVFMSRGWRPGGQRDAERSYAYAQKGGKGSASQFNAHYTPSGIMDWLPGKRIARNIEMEEAVNLEMPRKRTSANNLQKLQFSSGNSKLFRTARDTKRFWDANPANLRKSWQ